MRGPGMIGLCVAVAVVAWGAAAKAGAEAPPEVKGGNAAQKVPAKAAAPAAASTPELPDAAYLVREVVYNELHDHDRHGYWRYWVERHSSAGTQRSEAIETPSGPVARLELSNGLPLAEQARAEEDRRLERLLTSPSEQAQHLKDYQDDEHRIGRILAMLPGAFLFDPAQEEMRTPQMPECPCYHMRFHPNPEYPAHSIEARIFHAMAGDLWVSAQNKRMVRLEGKLEENVDFGFGILGRLYKDGWFQLDRTHVLSGVGAGVGDWKTQRLEVHMSGRAMFFKTISRETSELRGGFIPVPAGLTLEQAATLVRMPGSLSPLEAAALAKHR